LRDFQSRALSGQFETGPFGLVVAAVNSGC
jgi:hypothetical protein